MRKQDADADGGARPVGDQVTPKAMLVQGRDLLATVEQEIIPRLLLRHRSYLGEAPCVDDVRHPDEADVAALAELAIDPDVTAALKFVEEKLVNGATIDMVLLEIVGPAARLLGQQWDNDERSFTEVTVGTGTLQRLVHVLAPSFAPARADRGLIVLTTLPGEQHTFGIHLLAEFLRRADWGTHVEAGMTLDELCTLVSEHRADVVCVSVSNETLVKTERDLVAFAGAVTAASGEHDTRVLFGGSLDLSRFVGEDLFPVRDGDPRSLVDWLDMNLEH